VQPNYFIGFVSECSVSFWLKVLTPTDRLSKLKVGITPAFECDIDGGF
jgi:hypothetical protein